jgi:hypothetical protein
VNADRLFRRSGCSHAAHHVRSPYDTWVPRACQARVGIRAAGSEPSPFLARSGLNGYTHTRRQLDTNRRLAPWPGFSGSSVGPALPISRRADRSGLDVRPQGVSAPCSRRSTYLPSAGRSLPTPEPPTSALTGRTARPAPAIARATASRARSPSARPTVSSEANRSRTAAALPTGVRAASGPTETVPGLAPAPTLPGRIAPASLAATGPARRPTAPAVSGRRVRPRSLDVRYLSVR